MTYYVISSSPDNHHEIRVIFLILQRRKPRLREVIQLFQGHTAGRYQFWPGIQACKFLLITS